MSKSLSKKQLKVLSVIQKGMPLSAAPYADMAESIGMATEEFLDVLRQWKDDGTIRRAGAVVNHLRMGVAGGIMVAWDVPDDSVESVGHLFAAFKQVSHAYERPRVPGWKYNVFTMVHGDTPKAVETTIDRMSEKSGITDFRKLRTVRELKKTPPVYVKEE
ncbi:hypothetical protein STSP2_00884 [Anaerohalosphaera lusitana]|uniref:siroheme decarboxylase n=1 Tax=Anaerohalosphaera lusitana TaxID=1936003 RepID=A0A1U9NIT7_9BACT|nr:Lrp/AsnC family transcriptional regulator [Anaerohalosphaera lusitana]AQT67735.1 hypothetical protein STSP2_00884 [Anaerohalosphaera lusitana]